MPKKQKESKEEKKAAKKAKKLAKMQAKQQKGVEKLQTLGNQVPRPTVPEDAVLEFFDNPNEHPIRVLFETKEFTSMCPKTGQPDFAHVSIEYYPNRKCIESKSLKYYLQSFRNTGAFMEQLTGVIAGRLFTEAKPHYLRVDMLFEPRGGVYSVIRAEHGKKPEQE